jgi:serine kinase of HPr protein (carbohydrate metabolism regulator)
MTETSQIHDQIHGTCIAIDETAVIFLGPSGSGKSDLALRLIDEGATLIADDRIDISANCRASRSARHGYCADRL